MEIQALEWKPEDVSRHEKEKRDNIRRAVHEFLPPPPEGFYKLPPQVPPSMPSRQPVTTSTVSVPREPGLVKQASLGPSQVQRSVLTPQSSIERASALTRTVPMPQKRVSRVSLPAVSIAKPTPTHKQEPEEGGEETSGRVAPRSSSSSQEIFFPQKRRPTPPKSSVEEPVTSTTPFEETTSSTRYFLPIIFK